MLKDTGGLAGSSPMNTNHLLMNTNAWEKYLHVLNGRLKEDRKITVKIKISVNARKTEVKSIMTDKTLKISVAALPTKGKANKELITFLAGHFSVNKEDVNILKGLRSKDKLVQIIK